MWHPRLREMGMAVVPATITVAQVGQTLDANDVPQGDGGAALERGFGRFEAEFLWWIEAAKTRRALVD